MFETSNPELLKPDELRQATLHVGPSPVGDADTNLMIVAARTSIILDFQDKAEARTQTDCAIALNPKPLVSTGKGILLPSVRQS